MANEFYNRDRDQEQVPKMVTRGTFDLATKTHGKEQVEVLVPRDTTVADLIKVLSELPDHTKPVFCKGGYRGNKYGNLKIVKIGLNKKDQDIYFTY